MGASHENNPRVGRPFGLLEVLALPSNGRRLFEVKIRSSGVSSGSFSVDAPISPSSFAAPLH